METMLKDLVMHPELESCFEPGLEVINERPILISEGNAIVPDRLVFRGDKVWIIDYKTGVRDPKHEEQIENYASVLRSMRYQVQEKILVYVDKPVKVIKIESKIES